MSTPSFRAPYTFYGTHVTYQQAKAVVVPVPYEGTVSYQRGTSGGPHAIITASRQVELYDIELQKDISTLPVHTLAEVEPSSHSPAVVVKEVEAVTRKNISSGKFQVLLGGEHSLTSGAVSAYAKKYPDLSILQLDAHADLRDRYEGSPFNHACAMRRCREIVGRVIQYGIRSQSPEEARIIRKNGWATDIHYGCGATPAQLLRRLTKHVYLTVDLDVFDPSIMPATGTPEPSGLLWEPFCALLRELMKSGTVVGADVVELAPIPGIGAPDFLAAKVVHKILAYHFFRKQLNA